MIDIIQWRASIGAFNAHQSRSQSQLYIVMIIIQLLVEIYTTIMQLYGLCQYIVL